VRRASRKVGAASRAIGSRREEIGGLVDEGVLVADLQSGHPPVLHVRVVAIGDVYASPAAQAAFVAVIEVLQAVQIVQVPDDGRILAVDFERVQRLVAAGVARSLKTWPVSRLPNRARKRLASSMPTGSNFFR